MVFFSASGGAGAWQETFFSLIAKWPRPARLAQIEEEGVPFISA